MTAVAVARSRVDFPLCRGPQRKNERLGLFLSDISRLYTNEVNLHIKVIYMNLRFIRTIFSLWR